MNTRAICLFFILTYYCVCQAQSLTITSPPSGTTVSTGSSVVVNVSASGLSSSAKMSLFGSLPYTATNTLVSTPPYTFSIRIPEKTTPGKYSLFAIGTDDNGNGAESPSIDIIVTESETISSIRVQPPLVIISYPGVDIYPDITALTQTGKMVSIATDPKTMFLSANSSIVSVEHGRIVGISPGSTEITVSINGISAVVPVRVGNPRRGDFDVDGDVDSFDVARLQTMIGMKVRTPNDYRDLNRDGKIDALDTRILVTLCTRPRCATQ